MNVVETLKGLDPKKKAIAAVAVALVFVGILAIGRIGSSPKLELLYSGLDSAAAGDVVAALEGRDVIHEVRGTSIYVDARARDRLRMSLAAEGMPVVGAKGYELLDDLPGFGTTSQMFDAAYWRAKEGELARTIVAAPHIRKARVHLTPANSRPFQRGGEASAAVTVTSAGGKLSAGQADALRHLMAASVSALSVDNVAVIDDANGLIAPGEGSGQTAAADKISARLRENVERLLLARVGPGNAVVEVSVEQVSARETFVERRFDPEGRVAISADTEKRSETQQGSGTGSVTVASNLPDGAGADGAQGGQSASTTETRERTNFEVSETQREVERVPGDIKRLTVAVLLNDVPGQQEAGVPVPRSPEEMDSLRALVASAVGFDAVRGDEITIRSMAFVGALSAEGGAAALAQTALPFDLTQLVQLIVIALVVLVLGLFVLKPILLPRARIALAPPGPTDDSVTPGGLNAPSVELPAIGEPSGLPDLSQGFASLPDPAGFGGFDTSPAFGDEGPVARLKTMIAERQDESLQLLQSWIEGPTPSGEDSQ